MNSQLLEKPVSAGDECKENVALEQQPLISPKNILVKLEEEYHKINLTWCDYNSSTASLDWVKRVMQHLQEWDLDFNIINVLFQNPKFKSPETCNCKTHLSMSTLDDFEIIKISPQKQVILQLKCELRQLKKRAINNDCKSSHKWMEKAQYIFENVWSIKPEVSTLLIHKLI
ncbi:Hypothetical protein CINCED_3A002534 [Cinara cedri]|uniref:Uncharacterized protein n=1 Tax=Cinara cedri TaxID=506608 RepID=A0A5E4NKG2_9HEMI|nr:Hypothetical protein CINCED_3A002534 [Cinara cedri]